MEKHVNVTEMFSVASLTLAVLFKDTDDSDDKLGWLCRALCSFPKRSAARGLSVKITYLASLAMPWETERTPAPKRFHKRCVF